MVDTLLVSMDANLKVSGRWTPDCDLILNDQALEFIEALERLFGPQRKKLLQARRERQIRLDENERPDFLKATESVRTQKWQVATCPDDLQNRQVEITGPAEAKMMINALNSGADAFMADLEDSLSPTWENVILGQKALYQAVRHELSFSSPEGKSYKLNDKIATLLVRPRGWHLNEKHVTFNSEPISASLFDFGLYFFHNARERLERNTAPYFYLPKMESHLEARLWNDVFIFAQDYLKLPKGTIRATVLIETILAAFEMDEILFELKDHISGLNAGRWDYIFSGIKKFKNHKFSLLPDRGQVAMTVPFMRAYTELLVQTCHKRGAHAMGGMAAFIPSRKDAAINEVALKKVREDKEREAKDGFDGTWVAHPDLVPVAKEIFKKYLGDKPNQKDKLRSEVQVAAKDLISFDQTPGGVTEAGVRLNINVALQYLERWLSGVGAAAIHNLMEDAATAEISRAQLWQWIKHKVKLDTGTMDAGVYERIRDSELSNLGGTSNGKYKDAAQILDALVLGGEFEEFLTIPAYLKL